MNRSEIASSLKKTAEEKFGRERAEELESEIEQMAAQLESLDACDVEFEDEP